MSPVEDRDAPGQPRNLCSGSSAEGLGDGLALRLLHRREPNLDQLVIGQGLVGRRDDRVAHSAFAHLDDRMKMMREASKVPELRALERHAAPLIARPERQVERTSTVAIDPERRDGQATR